MQLLSSRGCASPEFASVSLLIKANLSGAQITGESIGEPLLIPSPVSTTSKASCIKSLQELHQYINLVFQSSKASTKQSSDDKFLNELLREDARTLDEMQVFRPLNAHGLGLHYQVIRDKQSVLKFIPLALSALNASSDEAMSKARASIESEVTAAVICVGITGLPNAIGTSHLSHGLAERMQDCIGMFTSTGTQDAAASRDFLATMLLTQEDDRLTNEMVERRQRLLLSMQNDAFDRNQRGGKLLAKARKSHAMSSSGGNADVGSNLYTNSSDLARIMVERLAVLSVAETDVAFRKYEVKAAAAAATGKSSKSRRKKAPRDADLDNFDFKGTKRSSIRDASSTTLSSDAASVASSSTSNFQLRGAKKDTRSSLNRTRQGSVPALSAPRKDAPGYRNRRSSGDAGSVARQAISSRRSSGGATANGNDSAAGGWSVDGSGHNSASTGVSFSQDFNAKSQSTRFASSKDDDSRSSGRTPNSNGHGTRRGRRNRENANFDPFTSQSTSETTATTESLSSRRSSAHSIDHNFGDDTSFDPSIMHGGRSVRSTGTMGSNSNHEPRMQVNVALNEDLTCTYKMSEMSSCSVEGILQVLIKSNFTTQAPFYLMIRDPSHHVQTIVEDRKCVENLSKDLQYDASESRPDYKFSVSVPKLDEYVPVLKYKCSSELRPVPMRVQTRVRRENQYWRVAVQISSNPHNEDNLTNLTIIMGVPPAVNGESMVTYPDGGKWNVSKRSVIWCVSELSRGEKFQLQARFEADPSVNGSDEQPKFPVLVRCECMYSQLSDIEVEVTDVPDVFATDMKMKLARRFRLSHRERP